MKQLDFECTLEELYNGAIKRLVYSRTIINLNGRTTKQKEEERDIELFRRYKIILKLPGFGNEASIFETIRRFTAHKIS